MKKLFLIAVIALISSSLAMAQTQTTTSGAKSCQKTEQVQSQSCCKQTKAGVAKAGCQKGKADCKKGDKVCKKDSTACCKKAKTGCCKKDSTGCCKKAKGRCCKKDSTACCKKAKAGCKADGACKKACAKKVESEK
ncbi:MAG: hypothetical protein ACI4AK_00285 [Lepagella sp.]